MVTFHNGDTFRAEKNMLRGSYFIVHNPSGRCIYLSGNIARKFEDALVQAWETFGFSTDGDTVYNWLWINAGFHRYA